MSTVFGGVPAKTLQCVFVAGLPDAVRLSLRSSSKIESMDLKEVLTRAMNIL